MSEIIITSRIELENLIQTSVRKVLQETSPHPPPETPDIIGISDVCRLTHLAPQTIYCLVWQTKNRKTKRNFPFIKRPGSKKLLFSRTAILQWMNGTQENEKKK